MKVPALVLWAMTTLASVSHAAEPVELRTELVAEVREVLGTQERRSYRMTPARRLEQGQVVYYTLRITNPTPVFATNVLISQRIPENTTYEPNSAAGPGADIEFSIDGGKSFAAPEALKVEGSSQAATPDRYTHIRWRLHNSLAPGATALARFRAIFH